MVNKQRLIGFVSCLGIMTLAANCAATFPYRAYVLDVDAEKLRGAKPEDDLPIKVCKSNDPNNKAECFVFFKDQYWEMRAKYDEMLERLKACESDRVSVISSE